MRSIWESSISFGLVNIPVKLYKATEEESLDFDMLHKKDLSPIRYVKVCKNEEKEVPYNDIVKGYEIQKGEYVVLDNKDFERANVRKTKTIDILSFAIDDEIDDIYFEKPYYLEPQKGSDKAYVTLREALRKSKKVGIAKFVLRNREHLGVVKPINDILVLDQIRFFDEIRDASTLKIFEAEIREKELEMAINLINQLAEPFKPEKYKDTYRKELEQVIEKKAKGKVPIPKGEEPKPTPVSDLMSALKASLEREKERKYAKIS